MPRLERQPALGIVDAHPKQGHEYQRKGCNDNPGREDELSNHFSFPEAIAADMGPRPACLRRWYVKRHRMPQDAGLKGVPRWEPAVVCILLWSTILG